MTIGNKKRLEVARALAKRPILLLLDELSPGLMPSLVKMVPETIVEINRKRTTILLVEQMVREALEIASRGYVIQTGRIVQESSARNLLESDSVRKAYVGLQLRETHKKGSRQKACDPLFSWMQSAPSAGMLRNRKQPATEGISF